MGKKQVGYTPFPSTLLFYKTTYKADHLVGFYFFENYNGLLILRCCGISYLM